MLFFDVIVIQKMFSSENTLKFIDTGMLFSLLQISIYKKLLADATFYRHTLHLIHTFRQWQPLLDYCKSISSGPCACINFLLLALIQTKIHCLQIAH